MFEDKRTVVRSTLRVGLSGGVNQGEDPHLNLHLHPWYHWPNYVEGPLHFSYVANLNIIQQP